MKKLILGFIIILLSACSLNTYLSPKEKVSEFLNKYKNQDSKVIKDLDKTISSEYTGDFKKRYINLMKKQYKDMSYKITNEVIDGKNAIVTADISVYDYESAIESANDYLSTHENEFYKDIITNKDKENSGSKTTNKILDKDKFMNYKLDLLEQVNDKKTYTIEFSLTNKNDEWIMDPLSDSDIEKIHGIYKD